MAGRFDTFRRHHAHPPDTNRTEHGMSRDRKPSNVTLTRLDLASKQAETDAFLKKHHGEQYVARFDFAYAAVEVNGALHALCTEGVGAEVTADSPLVIDVYKQDTTKPNSFEIMPVAQMKLGPDEVREIMTGEPVALEDFIRQFGARLEANYGLWLRILSPAALVEGTLAT